MTRRRLILAACVAIAALGAAWWLDGFSPHERLLVGTWHSDPDLGGVSYRVRFSPDRRFLGIVPPTPEDAPPCRWHVRGGSLVIDYEPSPIRRLLRRFAPLLGISVRPVDTLPLEVDEDRMIVVYPYGARIGWTRDRGD
jgi:hypothetical protein